MVKVYSDQGIPLLAIHTLYVFKNEVVNHTPNDLGNV